MPLICLPERGQHGSHNELQLYEHAETSIEPTTNADGHEGGGNQKCNSVVLSCTDRLCCDIVECLHGPQVLFQKSRFHRPRGAPNMNCRLKRTTNPVGALTIICI